MTKMKAIIASLIGLISILIVTSCSKSYYISPEGNDEKSGRSPESAWRSIERVNDHDFSPGDMIFFEAGEEFTGNILLSNSDRAAKDKPIVISSFGGGRAMINGLDKEALKADSCNFLKIENLAFTGLGRKSGNSTDGILISNSDGIVINNLEIFGFQHSGLHVHQCNDAVITHVYAHNNGFSGIHVTGNTMNDSSRYDNHNLYIGYCVAENNPGDPTVLKNHSGNGILASSVNKGVIEYCESFNNGWDMPWDGNGPVGIWIWDCTDFVIQYCISHHNRTNPKAADGGGFDFDGGVSNSIIQYCISHNNEGAGYGLYEFGAAKTWQNNTVRFNISQDDGIINGGSVGIWKNDTQGSMRNCEIYNNTFYNSLEDGNNIWMYDNYSGYKFRNNVFVYNGSLIAEGKELKDEVFQRNLYWNLSGDSSFFGSQSLKQWAAVSGKEMFEDTFIGLYQDPQFKNPGALVITDPELINSEYLSAYIPKSGSPLKNQGLNLLKMFGIDPGFKTIIGDTIQADELYNIGAF
jgi:hypothetical protein